MLEFLLAKNMVSRISMSAKGNPYDNPFAKSFFKTLKQEEDTYDNMKFMLMSLREFLVLLLMCII